MHIGTAHVKCCNPDALFVPWFGNLPKSAALAIGLVIARDCKQPINLYRKFIMTNASTQAAQSGASQNALKAGIYSNRLLPHEDPDLLQECVEGYVRDFEITTTAGFQIAQELAQVVLKLNRIEAWQADIIESYLAKYSTRFEFASQLKLNMLAVDKLPDWYFEGCQKTRAKARRIYSALKQLDYLIENHSVDLMVKIKDALPDLWWFVMDGTGANPNVFTFSDRLSNFSTQSDPRLRLKDLKNHISTSYELALNWAKAEDRYEKVLSGLRAQVQMDLLANPNLQRGEAALHRKKTDLLSQLIQLKREAQTLKIMALENSPTQQGGDDTIIESEPPRLKTKSGKGAKDK